MHAQPGDRIVIRSRTIGGPVRDAEVLEVEHEDGSPRYGSAGRTPVTRACSSQGRTPTSTTSGPMFHTRVTSPGARTRRRERSRTSHTRRAA